MLANNKMYLCKDINVTNDPYYRYQVDAPTFDFKKGCTLFTNSHLFSTQIIIDHLLFIKLIGKKLSCRTSIHKEINCGVFKGFFNEEQINNIICEIIQNYLLCQTCHTPEVILRKKKGLLQHKCKACGKKNYINNDASDMYEQIFKSFN